MTDSYLGFRRAPSAPAAQTPGPSPWSYTNASADMQMMTVSDGAVALIEINSGDGFVPAIDVAGTYPMFPGNVVKVTYVVSAPTVTMVQL